MMQKLTPAKIVQWVAVAVLLGLIFPFSNLFHPQSAVFDPTLVAQRAPEVKAAIPILQSKCFACHSSQTVMPFYANFPIAKDLIGKDMVQGLAAFDMEKELIYPANVSETALAKLERGMTLADMPPARYTALHWNAVLTDADKETLYAFTRAERKHRTKAPGVAAILRGEPVWPATVPKGLAPQKVALGNRLFHDTRLSGNQTISCASCHSLKTGGVDRLPVSVGIHGQKGGINSPSVINAGFNFVQFWDGRAATLQDQAGGPVTNPIEMGASWKQVLPRLKADKQYEDSFKGLYSNGITSDNVQNAIATFEETLVTENTRFDQYLKGNVDAITPNEKHGYLLFKSLGCASCHYGASLGGQEFAKMGVKGRHLTLRETSADLGRFNVTKRPEDKGKFKIPNLRNVANTAPYFHDASAKTLEAAVDEMARVQLGKTLLPEASRDIAQFLRSVSAEGTAKQ